MLEVNDLPKTIDFYTNVLGFSVEATWPDTGDMNWAELKAGDVIIMFMSRSSAFDQHTPVMTGQLYFYPQDVDALWQTLRNKTDIAWPIDTMPYGMREFAIRDCNGYLLTFGQAVDE
jgi:uncharacterized glyoxalase superfamily protein PhnB